MKTAILLLSTILLTSVAIAQKQTFYVGTGGKNGEGIYKCFFDEDLGKLEMIGLSAKLKQASFQNISADGKLLFSVHRMDDVDCVSSFEIGSDETLSEIATKPVNGSDACYVEFHKATKSVITANYASGTLSRFGIDEKGELIGDVQLYEHEGTGPNEQRQNAAHAHCIQQDLNSKYLYACDLGADKIYIYEPLSDGLKKVAEVKTEPGVGPRHLDFHPNGKVMAVLNELAGSVSLYTIDIAGMYTNHIETISALPNGFEGSNISADIHFTPDGKLLFASNRGHNSITTFRFDEANNKIEFVANQNENCEWVRNFAISPSGKFLLAAARKSNRVVLFKIDEESGKLNFADQVELYQPICITFLR